MSDLPILPECRYIAAFLTMSCNFHCSYCINGSGVVSGGYGRLSSYEWLKGLGRLVDLDRDDGEVPITLSGGEPSLHRGFYDIINYLPDRLRIDILTNLSFDVREMIERVDPSRLRRKAPYASIRVSYHPGQMELEELLSRVHLLLDAGFSVGVWGILHPDHSVEVLAAQERALGMGIDFRTKEFLGMAHGRLYGRYLYPQACSGKESGKAMCRTTELIIGPGGGIYRCHRDLYEHGAPIGNILDPFIKLGGFRPCDHYGKCNPCDVKLKTDRLQQSGYTAVEIISQGI